jgi:hypothetical protein
VGAVAVLADDGDPVAVIQPGIEHHAVADPDPGHAVAEGFDDPGPVRSQDAGLRNRREPSTHPDVEVVERHRVEPDQNLARAGDRLGDLFDAEDVRAAVLVDPHREHGTILS